MRYKTTEEYYEFLKEGGKNKGKIVGLPRRGRGKISPVRYHNRDTYPHLEVPLQYQEPSRWVHNPRTIVTADNDYDMRKKICEELYEKYQVEQIKFFNQSLTSISSSCSNPCTDILHRHITGRH